MIGMLTLEKTVTTHEKIDDDDGHYIVTEDMPIGDRCETPSKVIVSLHRLLLTVRRPSQQTSGPGNLRQSCRSL